MKANTGEIEVRILSGSERSLWDDLIESSDTSSFFSRRVLLDVVEKHFSQLHYLAAFKDGRIAGGLCLQQRGDDVRTLVQPSCTPFGGIIIRRTGRGTAYEEEQLRRAVSLAVLRFLEVNCQHVRIFASPENMDTRWFSWAGWAATPKFTYRLDIADEAGLKERVATHTRREIDDGYAQGYEVAESRDAGLLAGLYEPTYGHALPRGFFDDLVGRLHEHDCGRLFVAQDRAGVVRAGMLMPWDRHRCYGYFTCHDDTGDRTAYSFVRWEAMDRMRNRGFREFDWCGANTETRVPFKADFSPRLVPYGVVTWSSTTADRNP